MWAAAGEMASVVACVVCAAIALIAAMCAKPRLAFVCAFGAALFFSITLMLARFEDAVRP